MTLPSHWWNLGEGQSPVLWQHLFLTQFDHALALEIKAIRAQDRTVSLGLDHTLVELERLMTIHADDSDQTQHNKSTAQRMAAFELHEAINATKGRLIEKSIDHEAVRRSGYLAKATF